MPHLAPDYSLTPARRADIAALVDIDQAAAKLFEPTGLLDFGGELDLIPSDIFEMALVAGHVFVMRSGNEKPIGFTLTSLRGAGLYLDQISVHPKHGRQGLGRALVRKVLQDAKQRKLPEVTL